MPSSRPVLAVTIGFHSADSMSISVVFSFAARMFAAHDAGNGFDAVLIRDDAHAGGQLIFALVEAQHLLAVPGVADDEVALDLGGPSKTCRRPAAVEGDVVG